LRLATRASRAPRLRANGKEDARVRSTRPAPYGRQRLDVLDERLEVARADALRAHGGAGHALADHPRDGLVRGELAAGRVHPRVLTAREIRRPRRERGGVGSAAVAGRAVALPAVA